MLFKILHRVSGICICVFVGIHLANHLWSVFGAIEHIEMMNKLRVYYRNPVVEMFLLTSIVIQMVSGIKLYITNRTKAKAGFEKIQLWTGLYLLLFLIIHVAAVFGARLLFHLDTNFYFGVAGINTFPLNLFFIPYYAMAVISFFLPYSHYTRKEDAICYIWNKTYPTSENHNNNRCGNNFCIVLRTYQ